MRMAWRSQLYSEHRAMHAAAMRCLALASGIAIPRESGLRGLKPPSSSLRSRSAFRGTGLQVKGAGPAQLLTGLGLQ